MPEQSLDYNTATIEQLEARASTLVEYMEAAAGQAAQPGPSQRVWTNAVQNASAEYDALQLAISARREAVQQ